MYLICKQFFFLMKKTVIPTIGFQVKESLWSRKAVVNEPVSRMMYRKHNSYVRNVSFKNLFYYYIKDDFSATFGFLGKNCLSTKFVRYLS